MYDAFRRGEIRLLIVSKVANFAVDLPDANIAIQVSGTFGSRQEEAQRLGAVSEVVDDGQALASAYAWAARLVEASPTALAFLKQGLDESLEKSFEECLEAEALAVHHCAQTPEFAEQVRALFAKSSR